MNYYSVIFSTSMGSMAFVWYLEKNKFFVHRVYLPRPLKQLLSLIKKDYPDIKRRHHVKAKRIVRDLKRAVKGELVDFRYIPIQHEKMTTLQKKVYNRQRKIPRGQVLSYGELASKCGLSGGASRVVGSFQARNPFPLVIPCHRIVLSDRSLGSFQTGAKMKRELLEREGVRFEKKNAKFYAVR